ncbi:MAG: hypothetical protein JO303_08630, partial [Caulobacteraceae bacterium]|nr:hypothetical protein [Caulobacteraceae bacterium]
MRDVAALSGAARCASAPEMRPITFAGLLGWLHQAAGAMADTGVVLVSPLGRDERCAHMPMRILADQLAEAGFPTLRYDHLGEGDSLPLPDPEADALPALLDGIEQAVAQLRALTGVQRVVLGGVRACASLAMLRADLADGLLLLAPVLNGRSWLKRLRFSAGVLKAPQSGSEDLSIDSGDLCLNAATATSLAAVDLENAPLKRAQPIFAAAQNRLVRAWAEQLRLAGETVALHDFPGFDALFLDAHSNEPPLTLFDDACDWMQRAFGPTFIEAALPELPAAELRPAGASERAVVFGEGLRGVLCRPDRIDPGAPAVLFCNTGGDPRPGIGGFATTGARRLALEGAASLRFDFAGLGDSPMSGPELRSHVYETPRGAELAAAIDLLEQEGFREICIVGVCAGAYHALRLAPHDARIARVFAISPVKLIWRKGDSLAFGRIDDGKATQTYLQAVRDPKTWTRLLKGGIDLGAVLRTLGLRLRGRLLGLISQAQGVSPLADMRAF